MIKVFNKIFKNKPKDFEIKPQIEKERNLFSIAENYSFSPDLVKLNIGCGTDYREGFINIDGSSTLQKVDKVIDISKDSLNKHFTVNSVDYILANDIVEHHYHWEAVRLLNDFYEILQPGGLCEIRVPDCEFIIESDSYDLERKLVLLFGGQDIPQGVDQEMDKSRAQFPQFFCHKYGWSMGRMKNDLQKIGFKEIGMQRVGSNFITIARK